jgi:hypothetical protein
VARRAPAFGERLWIMQECTSVQECMSLVEEVQVGVLEYKVAFGDLQSIDKERGRGLDGRPFCRFCLRQNTTEEHRLEGSGVDCL